MALPDLSTLSDDELAATLILLGEQAQEITNATTCVRQELQRRAAPPPALPEDLGEVGSAALTSAVQAAPAKVKEIAADAAAVEAAAVTADG